MGVEHVWQTEASGAGGRRMANIDEQILRATKEIVVKFIESGRISPSGFHESFKDIYHTVETTAKSSMKEVRQKEKEE
jgi:hypothetical protein